MSIGVRHLSGRAGVPTATRSQDGPSRSTSHDEIAGPYRVGWRLSSQAKNEIAIPIQAFLGVHFKGKIPGRREATSYILEGDSSKSLFFVDADQTGEWGISETISIRRSPAFPKKKPIKTVVEEKCCYVSKIDPSGSKISPM
jgi:hypothetical protein